jgi:ATP-dependent metalloprotease FtsH
MSNNSNDFEVDTGAGVGFSEAVDFVERTVPTPVASLLENQKQEQPEQQPHTAVNISQEGAYSGSYNGYDGSGLNLASVLGRPSEPVYVRLQEDPNEVQKRNTIAYINLGISICGMLIVLIFFGSLIASQSIGGDSHHLLIEQCDVKFDDVHGCDEVKVQLERIVKYLKDPSEFKKFGAKMPRGYLLSGPPGVGKTMLAKAVAGESEVAFLTISGAEFEQVFVGVGAARVRSLFKDARRHKKAVIFIDEIDAIAGKRNSSATGDSSVSRQTINQLLVEMDGFKTTDSIVVLAATNMPASLDPAILRPGRFDKIFKLSPPNLNGRENLLKKLIGEIPAEKREDGELKNLDIKWLAKITIGYTGADLTNLVNQAKLIASAEQNTTVITKEHFFRAKEFIDVGPEREQSTDPKDIERTAYHEAGHAIIGLVNQSISDELAVEYATVVPHGDTLGLVLSVPQKELNYQSLKMLKCRLELLLGGFMAEARFYKDKDPAIQTENYDNVSTGASSDFEGVNYLAHMIVDAGFGEKTGFLQKPKNPLDSSEEYKKNYEADVKKIIDDSKARVATLLESHDDAWKALAKELIDKKSLNKAQINQIFNDKKPKNP